MENGRCDISLSFSYRFQNDLHSRLTFSLQNDKCHNCPSPAFIAKRPLARRHVVKCQLHGSLFPSGLSQSAVLYPGHDSASCANSSSLCLRFSGRLPLSITQRAPSAMDTEQSRDTAGSQLHRDHLEQLCPFQPITIVQDKSVTQTE